MEQKCYSLCLGAGHNSSKRFFHIWDFDGKETVTRFPHCTGQRFRFALNISPVGCYRSEGQTRVGKPPKIYKFERAQLANKLQELSKSTLF